MRRLVLALSALLMLTPTAAALEPHPHDTYLGQRAYPDPFIGDGWRGSDGYRKGQYLGTSWYLLRITPVVQIYDHGPARATIHGDIEALRR